jgi:hypothetical protein
MNRKEDFSGITSRAGDREGISAQYAHAREGASNSSNAWLRRVAPPEGILWWKPSAVLRSARWVEWRNQRRWPVHLDRSLRIAVAKIDGQIQYVSNLSKP